MDINITSNFSVNSNGTLTPSETSWSKILVASIMSPIILLGTIGNVLSLLVWVKVRRCRNSTARFLAALAIADLMSLLMPGVNFWMTNVVERDLRDTGSFACKFLNYVDFAAQFSSAWTVVLVTIERTFAVWVLHQYKKACRPRISIVVIIVTNLAVILLCLPFLVSADISSAEFNDTLTKHVCIFMPESTLVTGEITWFYAELVLHFGLPFILIIVSNSSILLKATFHVISRRRSRQNLGHGHDRARHGNNRKMMKKVSIRIIVISIAFCLGVGPIHVYGYKETLTMTRKPNYTDPLYLSFVVLMYLNNAVNFFLYCFIGSGFKKDLVGLFRHRPDSCPV